MSTIVNRFSNNKNRNDFLVKRFIEEKFSRAVRSYDVNKQGAKAQFQVQ